MCDPGYCEGGGRKRGSVCTCDSGYCEGGGEIGRGEAYV